MTEKRWVTLAIDGEIVAAGEVESVERLRPGGKIVVGRNPSDDPGETVLVIAMAVQGADAPEGPPIPLCIDEGEIRAGAVLLLRSMGLGHVLDEPARGAGDGAAGPSGDRP